MRHLISILVLLAFVTVSDAGPLSSQGPTFIATGGVIDPTVATWNSGHPMVACSSSCLASIADNNRTAFQLAIATANSDHRWIYLPPGEYPMSRSATNILIGIDFSGTSNIVMSLYGVTLRAQGDLGLHDFTMLLVRNASRIRFLGGTYSLRDVTNPSAQTHEIGLGDGGTAVDDVQILDGTFTESIGGDCIRTLGGATSSGYVTRVTIANNSFLDCHRDAISVQRGVSKLNITNNKFNLSNSGSNEDIDFEPTSPGVIGSTTATENWFTRASSSVTLTITITGYSAANPAEMNFLTNNHMSGGVLGVADVRSTWIDGNTIYFDRSPGGNGPPNIQVSGSFDVWTNDNWLYRGPNASNNFVLYYNTGNGRTPNGVNARGNRIYQYSGVDDGIEGNGVTHFTWAENRVTYGYSTADSGGNGFFGLVCRSAVGFECQGQVQGNIVKRGTLSDGVTAAGRMVAGFLWQRNSSTISAVIMRDNRVDGARACHYSGATSTANWPDGLPLVPGDSCVNYVNDFEGAPPAYRRESTGTSEQLTASGALNAAKHNTFVVGDCASDTFTLADQWVGGFIKHVEINGACVSVGTLTPAHFGDGTSLSWSVDNTHPTASADLVWDSTSSIWRLLSSSRITVNP